MDENIILLGGVLLLLLVSCCCGNNNSATLSLKQEEMTRNTFVFLMLVLRSFRKISNTPRFDRREITRVGGGVLGGYIFRFIELLNGKPEGGMIVHKN